MKCIGCGFTLVPPYNFCPCCGMQILGTARGSLNEEEKEIIKSILNTMKESFSFSDERTYLGLYNYSPISLIPDFLGCDLNDEVINEFIRRLFNHVQIRDKVSDVLYRITGQQGDNAMIVINWLKEMENQSNSNNYNK